MAKFVKLTDNTDEPLWVNPEHVVRIRQVGKLREVDLMFADGSGRTVRGEVEAIVNALAGE